MDDKKVQIIFTLRNDTGTKEPVFTFENLKQEWELDIEYRDIIRDGKPDKEVKEIIIRFLE